MKNNHVRMQWRNLAHSFELEVIGPKKFVEKMGKKWIPRLVELVTTKEPPCTT